MYSLRSSGLSKMVIVIALVGVVVMLCAGWYRTDAQQPVNSRPVQAEGPAHTNELVHLVGPAGLDASGSSTVKILINTGGSGSLTGIKPVAEKDYWMSLLQSNPDYSVSWYDGIASYSVLSTYDMVIYDAGGYWHPLSGAVDPLWQYHFSGKPLIVVAPDVNYDWNDIKDSSRPTFSEDVLHIGGVRGIMPASAFTIYANTGHEIVAPMGTNTQIPVASQSSYPDSFAPTGGGEGVLRQGVATIEWDRGTVLGNPGAYSFGPSGNLYSVAAFPGTTGEGRVVTFGFPPTAIQNSALLDQLCSNAILYALKSIASVRKVALANLYVDDASTGTMVLKTPGDKLELIAVVKNDEATTQNVVLTLEVPTGWVFDNHCYVRDPGSGSINTLTTCQALPGGQYAATLPIPASATKEIGLRFTLPVLTPAGVCVQLSGQLAVTGGVALERQRTTWLDIGLSAEALIVTNRQLLYDTYDDGQVTSLLTYLSEIADSNKTGEVSAAIYYADWYAETLRTWNNTAVTYPTPANSATTNAVADTLDNLIEDWASRLGATYLMIVGDDAILPMYRVSDASMSNKEKDMPTHNPDYSLARPAFTAIRNNHFFSDAPYADTAGDDWLNGEGEIAVGRIVGLDAAALQATIRRGVDGPANTTNKGILASSGVCNVGGTSAKRCYDLDGPREMYSNKAIQFDASLVESETWDAAELVQAMNGSAFSWFVEGGHADYNLVDCPNAGTSCDKTDLTSAMIADSSVVKAAIDTYNPFVAIGGCHGGLVESSDSPPAGSGTLSADDCNVCAWLQRGAVAVLGSTGLVGGSFACGSSPTGESWFSAFFREMAPTDWIPFHAPPTRTIGEASLLARKNYKSEKWPGSDSKAVTEFVLYGVPWAKGHFPNESKASAAQTSSLTLPPAVGAGTITHLGEDASGAAYSRLIDFQVTEYTFTAADGYELVDIPGATQNFHHLEPVLPRLVTSIALPPSAAVSSLSFVSGSSSSLGIHHIPSAWESTTTDPQEPFTDTTNIAGLYPVPNYMYDFSHFADHTEVNIYFFPVQYHPQTGQTTLWASARLQLTYASPSAAVVSAFASEKPDYHVAEPINTATVVENVGASTLSGLTPYLTLRDTLGTIEGTTTGSPFSVPSGERLQVTVPFSGTLADGTHVLEMNIKDASLATVAESTRYIHVLAGEITAFEVPPSVEQEPAGVDIPFTIFFANHRPATIQAEADVKIYDSAGKEIAHLLSTPFSVGPHAVGQVQLFWNSLNKPSERYQATAKVSVGGTSYGPTSRQFEIVSPQPIDVEVAPFALETTLTAVSISTQSLTISNIGGGLLNFAIAEGPTVVGAEFPVAAETIAQGFPAVACNTQNGEYLVVWEEAGSGRDIYAQRITPTGQLQGDRIAVCTASQMQERPVVAYSSQRNEYLVVWQSGSGEGDPAGPNYIHGQRLSWDGQLQGGLIKICEATDWQIHPDLAYNSLADEYLVVWQTGIVDIMGQRVAGSGTLLGGMITLCNAFRTQNSPSVAYNPHANEYLVAWDDYRNSSDFNIHGCRVSAAGVPGTDLQLCSQAGNQLTPEVAFCSATNEYLVAWPDEGVSPTDLYVQRVSEVGGLVGSAVNLSTTAVGQWDPGIVFDPILGEYLVVWAKSEPCDIHAVRLSTQGALLGDEFPICAAAGDQNVPVIALNPVSGNYLVAWQDARSGSNPDIYAYMPTGSGPTPDVPWLSENPVSGTVPSGMALPVLVSFDASGMPGGTHTATLFITTNDPDENQITVPVTLHVLSEVLPVSQVTMGWGSDYDPSLVQAADGRLLLAFDSHRSGNWDIWFKTSSDGGTTWSTDTQLTTDTSSDYIVAITQAADGKLWVVWSSYRSGNWDIWYKTSSTGGTTWSSDIRLTTDASQDLYPAVFQASAGKLWVLWYSYRSGNADIWYKTTSNGGVTWSADAQLTNNTDGDYGPAIAQAADGKLWVLWYRETPGPSHIWFKTSIDGGATWSAEARLTANLGSEQSPSIARATDGTLWLTWHRGISYGAHLWYQTSGDNGATWSAEKQWTRFMGYDYFADLAALNDGSMALAWQSDRASNNDIWFGIFGWREDIDPPPHVGYAYHLPGPNPDSNDTVTVRAHVADETAVQSVRLVWTRDGAAQTELPMYDDGAHNDYASGDAWYGMQLAPLPVGAQISYRIRAEDSDGNSVTRFDRYFTVLEPFSKTAAILFVADQGPSYDTAWFRTYYTQAFDDLDWDYDLWDVHLRGAPDAGVLNQYLAGVVVWANPSSDGCLYWWYDHCSRDATLDALRSYLDAGGQLFISGQYIGENLNGNTFLADYLHAQYVQADVDLYRVNGLAGDPIGQGLTLGISGGDGANNQSSPDEIDPIAPAAAVFRYDPTATSPLLEPARLQSPAVTGDEVLRPAEGAGRPAPWSDPLSERSTPGSTAALCAGCEPQDLPADDPAQAAGIASSGTAALRVDTGAYQVAYFAFGFESINARADRALVMDRVLSWLGLHQTHTIVALQPSDKTVYSHAGPFTMDAAIQDVSSLGGFQFTVLFDPAIVHVQGMSLASFVTSGTRPFTPVGPDINNVTGRATFGAFSFGAQPGPTGSGPMTTITFTVVATGTTSLTFTGVQVTDPSGNVIPVSLQSGSITAQAGLEGDMDGDCDVDIVDIMLVAGRWNSRVGDARYDARYDVDHDGDIDIVDIMRVAARWNTHCGAAAGPG